MRMGKSPKSGQGIRDKGLGIEDWGFGTGVTGAITQLNSEFSQR